MRNKIYAGLIILFLMGILIVVISPAASAAELDTEAIAERVRAKFETELAKCDEEIDYPEEYVLKNQAASRDGDRLNEYLVAHKDGELYRHYAGHYINEEQILTIMLSCTESVCMKEIKNIGFETTVEIRTGDFGSYFDTIELLREINSKISKINLAVLHGEGTDKEAELMDYYPCTHYEHMTNSIWISVVAQDKEAEEYAILLFKELVGDYPEVTYGTCRKEDVTAENFTTVKPGQGLFFYNSDTGGRVYSTGYRAKYTENGITYYGIITSAHYNATFDVAYCYDSSLSTITAIGSVKKLVFNNPVDAAFIVFNSSITTSQYIYYSSFTGSTAQTHYLNGISYSPTVGDLLYKSGVATYRTSETITSVNSADYLNGVYLSDMIAVPGSIASNGDSGGIAYKLLYGSNTAGILGIVEGGDNDITLFIKASNINSYLGVSSY